MSNTNINCCLVPHHVLSCAPTTHTYYRIFTTEFLHPAYLLQNFYRIYRISASPHDEPTWHTMPAPRWSWEVAFLINRSCGHKEISVNYKISMLPNDKWINDVAYYQRMNLKEKKKSYCLVSSYLRLPTSFYAYY
jgi:hypothetical protein